jgi:hypothetical protein
VKEANHREAWYQLINRSIDRSRRGEAVAGKERMEREREIERERKKERKSKSEKPTS